MSNTLSLHTIIQEETVMGKVVFEIPQSDVPYELRYDDGNSNVTIVWKAIRLRPHICLFCVLDLRDKEGNTAALM